MMLLEAAADDICLLDVDRRHISGLCRALKDVQTGPGKFIPRLCLGKKRTWTHNRVSSPVRFLDDPQPIGDTVGQEDSDGKRTGPIRGHLSPSGRIVGLETRLLIPTAMGVPATPSTGTNRVCRSHPRGILPGVPRGLLASAARRPC